YCGLVMDTDAEHSAFGNYIAVFGDPRDRIENMFNRAVEKGKDMDETLARLYRYQLNLPASIYITQGNRSYLQCISEDRRFFIQDFETRIYGDSYGAEKVEFERTDEYLRTLTL